MSGYTSISDGDAATPAFMNARFDELQRAGADIINVKHPTYGATGDGSTDDTTAIQAAINAAANPGDTIVFPPGNYKLTSTLNLGRLEGRRFVGAGSPGLEDAQGGGTTNLVIAHSGVGLTYAVGEASARQRGFLMENLRIVADEDFAPTVGLHIGNASNCYLKKVTVSDFEDGIGIKLGESSTSGSQYHQFEALIVSRCKTGIQAIDTNGARLIGGFFEYNTANPPASTKAIELQEDADTWILIGVVIQGYHDLLDSAGDNTQVIGCRFEGWGGTAVEFSGRGSQLIGGSMNNSIAGSGGTGIHITATAEQCAVAVLPEIRAVGTQLTDDGTNTNLPTLGRMLVRKEGVGAQQPEIVLMSNDIEGPTLGLASGFARAVLDHAWASASGWTIRVRGEDITSFDYDGSDVKQGFFGNAAITKPEVTGSTGSNAALESLLTALANLGLITDSSS